MMLAVLPLLLLAATYAIATIDTRNHDNRVLRSVTLGQTDVSGMTSDELDAELDLLDQHAAIAAATPPNHSLEFERVPGYRYDEEFSPIVLIAYIDFFWEYVPNPPSGGGGSSGGGTTHARGFHPGLCGAPERPPAVAGARSGPR